jgi:hypothetical protein
MENLKNFAKFVGTKQGYSILQLILEIVNGSMNGRHCPYLFCLRH